MFFSCQVMSDSLQTHVLQHTRLLCHLPPTTSQKLLKLMPIESVMPSNHLILCRPLVLLPSVFPSSRVLPVSWLFIYIRCPKYWSFCFSISHSNVYSGLISFRIDWCDLLPSKGLSSLLQHHSSKTSVIQHSTFFKVQLSS